jgi:ferredoxin
MRLRFCLPGRKASPLVTFYPLPRNGIMKPRLIPRRCPAQRDLCKAIKACTTGAIYYVEDESEPLGGKILFDYAKCDACGLCVTECCGQAIEMAEA